MSGNARLPIATNRMLNKKNKEKMRKNEITFLTKTPEGCLCVKFSKGGERRLYIDEFRKRIGKLYVVLQAWPNGSINFEIRMLNGFRLDKAIRVLRANMPIHRVVRYLIASRANMGITMEGVHEIENFLRMFKAGAI